MFSRDKAFVVAVAVIVFVGALTLALYQYFEGPYEKVVFKEFEGKASVALINRTLFTHRINATNGLDGLKPIDFPIKGKVNIVTPQYVNCPNICHLESAVIAFVAYLAVRQGLDDIVIVTVEVDPWNTSLERVNSYMQSWVKKDVLEKGIWTWLIGSPEEMKPIWMDLGIAAQKMPDGTVAHTGGYYIIGPDGKLLYFIVPSKEYWSFEKAKYIGSALFDLAKYVLKDYKKKGR